MQPEYEPIPCRDHETHPEHIWTHPEFGEVECLGIKCTGIEGQPEDLHNIWGCKNCNPITHTEILDDSTT